MANEYVTSAQLKATLSISGETYADADVAVAVETASRAIDEACSSPQLRRRFYPDADANQVRYYDPTSSHRVRIDDLIALTSLKTDADGDGTFETTWLSADFVLGPYNAAAHGWPYESIARRAAGAYYFPHGIERSVQVTGRFGWAAPVPAPIVQATTILAVKLLKRAREAPFAIVGAQAFGEGAAARIARTDPDIVVLTKPYARGGRLFG